MSESAYFYEPRILGGAKPGSGEVNMQTIASQPPAGAREPSIRQLLLWPRRILFLQEVRKEEFLPCGLLC
jgi:hypothetical protein